MTTDRKTAAARVADAEKRRDKWYDAARQAAAQASRAERGGKVDIAAKAREREARALRLAKQHEQTVSKYTPIASMADRARRVSELGKGLKKAWDEERRVSARKAARSKRKPAKARVAPDPILTLTKTGRMDHGQIGAARRYREAWDACHASLQGTLNPDRVGGGGGNRSLSPRELAGAEFVNLAWRILGENDSRVLHMVVGEGYTIAETAHRVYGGRSTRREQEWTGVRLREALSTLAKGLKRPARPAMEGEAPPSAPLIRSPPAWMDTEALAALGTPFPADYRRPVKRGKVAHVDRRGVDYSS